ncbi:hypothetical protein FRC04_006858 [Tulasnella sp. 424]|nr:hypothetical protein FRC04_006858 [Tulasnella sp. 424]KAG8974364.1 hypothetical protein FRC05_007525 [Tulasnella sp. 425]
MFLYGGYCIVFAITIRCLALRTRKGRSKVVFSTMLGLFLTTTTTIVLCTIDNYNGWIKRRNDGPRGTLAYFSDPRNAIRVTRDLLLLCAALMADGLICWRLLVIWAHNYWVLIFPVLLLVAEAVIGILLVAFEYNEIVSPSDGRFQAFFKFGPIFVCVCSATVNIAVTSLISGRLWLIQRRVEGLADKDTYNRIIRVLIESGAIYTATIFVFFVFVVAGLPGAYRFVDYLVTVAVAIAPTLIVLQLNYSRKPDGNDDGLHSTTIEFHTPSVRGDDYDDDRSSYRVSSIFDVQFTDLPSSPATSRFRDRRRLSLRSPPSRGGGGSTPSLTAASTTSPRTATGPRFHLEQPSNSSLRTTSNLLRPSKSRLRKDSSSQWSTNIPLTPLRTSTSIPRMPSAAHVGSGGMGSEVSLSPTTVDYYYHQPPATAGGSSGDRPWVSHAEQLASGEHWTLGLEGPRLQSSPEFPPLPPPPSGATTEQQAAPRGFRPHDLRVSTVEEGSREGSGASGENGGITMSPVLANVGINLNDDGPGPAPEPEEERLPPLPSPLSPRPSMSPILRPSVALSRPSISSLREGGAGAGIGAGRARTLSSPVAEARPSRSSPLGVEGRPSLSSLAEAGRPSMSRPSTSSLRDTYTAPAPAPRPPAPGRRRQQALRERRSDLEDTRPRMWK